MKRKLILRVTNIPSVSCDVKDDKFLATVAISQADYLVTEDNDLLNIKEHRGARIVTAAEFLRILDDLGEDG